MGAEGEWAVRRVAEPILAALIAEAHADALPDRSASADAEIAVAQRLVLASNLVKVGGAPCPRDRETLAAMLDRSGLPGEVRDMLRDAFQQPRQHPVDFGVFGPEQALALTMELVSLAHRHRPRDDERAFVRQAALRVGFPAHALVDL